MDVVWIALDFRQTGCLALAALPDYWYTCSTQNPPQKFHNSHPVIHICPLKPADLSTQKVPEMSKVRVTVPATSANLGPGYNSLALALSLHNIIELSSTDYGLAFDLAGEGTEDLPRTPSNLIVRAAVAVFRRTGCVPSGLHVALESSIPVGSGLGSSAAAILGGVVAANVLVGSPLDRAEILQTAVEVEGHPEAVTAALYGGLVACTYDRGELIYASLPLASMQVVVALPLVAPTGPTVPLPAAVSLDDAASSIGRSALVAHALGRGDFQLLGQAMHDRLHEPTRRRLIPACDAAVRAARQAGASAVAISGAGPSLIAFAPHHHEAIASALAGAFADGADLPARTWILPVDTQGISISEIGVSLAHNGQPTPASPKQVEDGEGSPNGSQSPASASSHGS